MVRQPYLTAETPAPPPGALVSHHNRSPFGYAGWRASGTKDWLLMYTLSGEGCVKEGPHAQLCRAGDMIVLPPGTPHDYFTTEGSVWEMMWVHFIPRPAWAAWLQWPKVSKSLLFLHIGDDAVCTRIEAAFRSLIADNKAVMNPLFEELALNALEEILLLAASLHYKKSSHTLDPRIHEVLDLLSQNIKEPVSVTDLAKKVNLSPSRLAHLFKEQTGDSMIGTWNKMRLKQAARLLELTSRQVTEIAEDVGFQSPDYFTSKFKQYFGVSPSTYRKQLRK